LILARRQALGEYSPTPFSLSDGEIQKRSWCYFVKTLSDRISIKSCYQQRKFKLAFVNVMKRAGSKKTGQVHVKINGIAN